MKTIAIPAFAFIASAHCLASDLILNEWNCVRDDCWLNSTDIGNVTENLLRASHEQRAANPCIGRERADLVLAGCAILEEIRLAFPAERIRVADRGLREGILTLLMKQDGTYGRTA